MTYTKESKEWKQIVAGADHWFSKSSMAWHGSKIYWNTLYKVDSDYFYFITSEDNFDKSKKLFSIRSANFEGRNVNIATVAWQEYETLASADYALAEIITAND
jgi:hypothetical protein